MSSKNHYKFQFSGTNNAWSKSYLINSGKFFEIINGKKHEYELDAPSFYKEDASYILIDDDMKDFDMIADSITARDLQVIIPASTASIQIRNSIFSRLIVESYGSNRPYLNDFFKSKIDSLIFEDCTIDKAPYFVKSIVKSLNISHCKISGKLLFQDLQLPRLIRLNDLDFKDSNSLLDLTGLADNTGQICVLSLGSVDFNHVRLNYKNFKLDFQKSGDFMLEPIIYTRAIKENIYKTLIDEQKRDGFEDGLKKAEAEYEEFKSFEYDDNNYWSNFLQKHLWNYGLDTHWLLPYTLAIFFLISILNFMCYEKMLMEGYSIPVFLVKYQILKQSYKPKIAGLLNYFYCLLYTGNLFWGFKIDFDKIKFEHTWLVIWIYFQYILGIISVTFLVHYYFVEK